MNIAASCLILICAFNWVWKFKTKFKFEIENKNKRWPLLPGPAFPFLLYLARVGRWRPLLSRTTTIFASDRPAFTPPLHVGPSGQVSLPHVTNSLAGCCVLGLGCWDWMCSGLRFIFMRAMGATRAGQNTCGSITRSTRLISSSARLGSF
jgi:hypothetical protein